jgi:hypothetical protein
VCVTKSSGASCAIATREGTSFPVEPYALQVSDSAIAAACNTVAEWGYR